ncbi:hypothetical protein QVD17_34117 [Tagetes erecta]|uniref:DOMON domain-containing protein n=1 Tax=Tagetes erecta TaxID=13708 RepID=A0AAD8K1P9_TARER|nr:hypothetical protein QVD17_34117 [Tagetes erecta]
MTMLRLSSQFFFLIFITLTSLVLQSSPAHSLSCSSKNFTNKKVYSNCTDLPALNSTLHWSYTVENSSLSIAFTAPPATPDGWVAWAINPTQTGMAGCQTLIAFKDSNGSMTVKTYNISSYSSIVEGKIAFEVPEAGAEFSGEEMRIFATVKLPKTMTEVNHVWQVGGLVKDGRPGKHEFSSDNLKAMGKLELVSAVSPSAVSPAVAPSTSSATVIAGSYGVFVIIGCLLGLF